MTKNIKTHNFFALIFIILFLTNCVGVHPQKVDISKIKKERKLPEPDFFIPDAQYITAGYGSSWNLRQFLDFRFFSPPFFNSKETKQHKAAVYMAIKHIKDFEVVSWYSKSRDAGGKVRPIFTYLINSSICRDFQVLLYIGKKARSKTLTACKMNWGYWSFNYWDWPGAEKYLN